MQPTEIAGLSHVELTYVSFPEGDLVAQALAYVTLTPIFLVVVVASALFFRRELEAAWALAGVLANTAVCVLAKRILRQPRPDGARLHGHGMPSNHSMLIAFLAAYATGMLWRRYRPVVARGVRSTSAESHAAGTAAFLWLPRALVIAVFWAGAALVAYSRVYLDAHTPAQVLVGLALGAFVGVAWDVVLGERLVRPYLFPWVECTRLARLLCLKDSGPVYDVLAREREWSLRERGIADTVREPREKGE